MKFTAIDIGIIVLYLVSVLAIGFLCSRRAGQSIHSYFLGGNRIPYPLLGIANASGMFDITGTMWLVTLFFIYGMKSVFIPWLWPIFNQVFLMIYLARWLRRSGVMTGAEWIGFRFGQGTGATLSHLSVVVFALVSVVSMLAYSFQGIGKFAAVFFPWDWPPSVYAIVLMGITTVYVIAGGMYSVVVTDLLQYAILTASGVCIAWIAMTRTTAGQIAASVPAGWADLFFGWKLNLDWSGLLEAGNTKIAQDGWEYFTVFVLLMLFKGIPASMAGPAPNYDMQRILATRNPREAGLMSWFTCVSLFVPRYLMVASIGVLGLVFYRQTLNEMGSRVDFEQVMPYVLNHFVPSGLLGFVLAGLLAAFMSTFDCTVNAGASYVVKDLYQRYIRPDASSKRLVRMSYISSLLIVLAGIGVGFTAKSIHQICEWIVAGLYGGYIAPNVLKWHWWRFNGYGYFAGMAAGLAASLVFPLILPGRPSLYTFPLLFGISLAASIGVSLMTRPDAPEVLKRFYVRTRPWGFWGPVLRAVREENPAFVPNRCFRQDMVNAAVGIVWQLSLCTLPFYFVLRHWKGFWISGAVLAATSIFLKRNWYDRLGDEVESVESAAG
ncbi:MAG TPA: Na+:solute symporter [Anaerohalosphaeraceae bacterium]|nr:Na+:solute symporter [Anaerohalosphaeraceae bacterium]HOL87952.1 Na+:solute symporter [Anaerohalosphaeraceae bacterium]